MSAPPGWHRQPDGRERYWDGQAWTGQFRGITAPEGASTNVAVTRPGFYKPWMGYLGTGLIGLFLGVGVGSAGGDPGSTEPAAAPVVSAPVVTQTVQTTVTATATATPTPTLATTTPEPSPSDVPTVESFKMPRLVGENLQLAQDKLQKLGSYVLDQQDALGLDRIQVIDSNWKVCSQKPVAGKKVTADTVVVLASVKLTEDCP